MAKGSVNRVLLIGNLGRDPEVRYTPNGTAVTQVSIATTEVWKDKQSGENQERTEWHRVVMYARLAEIAGEYLRKGSKIFIEGRLQTRKWQDKNSGQDRYTTEVIADSMQMLDNKGAGHGGSPAAEKEAAMPAAMHSEHADSQAPDNFDDDIPF